jgi:curli biogenesis system outer membrane secretion channel CsgG
MNRELVVSVVLFVALACGVAGCGKPPAFIEADADLGFYETVAVTPFWVSGADRSASDQVTDSFVTALMISEKYAVVEPGLFRHLLADVVNQASSTHRGLTPEQVQELGEKAGAQAIFEGSILNYEMTRIGQNQYPLISVELRMLDAQTGRLVWSMNLTRKGGPGVPFFGFGQTHTLPELAAKVVDELIAKVP